jgi:hypothetical protein
MVQYDHRSSVRRLTAADEATGVGSSCTTAPPPASQPTTSSSSVVAQTALNTGGSLARLSRSAAHHRERNRLCEDPPVAEWDELVEARRRFPVGDRVRGRVSAVPWGPGRTGLFVDLGSGPGGFVDVLHLPEDSQGWPPVGYEGFFEVIQHRPGQVRLFPLDAGMRPKGDRPHLPTAREWETITDRYPLGLLVTGVVTDVFARDREYGVRFDDVWSVAEYDDIAPAVGTAGSYVVTRHMESIRHIRVEPAAA